MISSKHRFVLDLHSTQSQVSVPATQNDSARELYISFSDGGAPYIIEDGILARLDIKRPTGTYLTAFCTIENNTTVKFAFEQNPDVTAEEGIHDCYVILVDGEGHRIASAKFSLIVSSVVIDSDDLNISDAEKSILDAYLDKVASYEGAEIGRVNAENARDLAEKARAQAEIDRELAFAELTKFATPVVKSITLLASAWVGEDDPYSQVIEIEGVTEKSKVDLLPSIEQLAIFHDKDLTFVTENDGGVVTVFAIGDKPTRDYTIEVCITEVQV